MNARRPLISGAVALVVVLVVAVVAAAGSESPPSASTSADPTVKVAKISIEGVGSPGSFLNVLAYEWSGQMPEGGAGRAQVGELSIVRRLDGSTPSLFRAFAIQRHIDSVVLDVLVPGSTASSTEYKLTEVTISSFHHNATGTPDYTFPYDRIGISFGRVCISALNRAGEPVSPVCFTTA
jgi:hypothetical protein